ncbi:hypothetical protein [Kaistella jeonii]|uniref:Uncharacterized protein n=1 Tax=Kaistella jeonii TaxID=266749 RepID=A0A0C1CXH0_9FLAO|nr:hypothetical protein [Kaistella jeonii]KIA89066.1 hypothetical protein OA86_08315 [Kaistella jeonii]SFB95185.1 hypothetical protein SAMN05421876_10496 [Kaistella jeonii]VEI97131.1 Uncharacterised protein [Kaistella jeonii]
MKIQNLALKKSFLHHHRLLFSVCEIPIEKRYIESKTNSFIILIATSVLVGIILYATDYSENIVKIGIFALLFNLYKIYQVYFLPLLILNEKGVELRAVRVTWKNIKRIEISWKQGTLHLQINLLNGKVVNEKVEKFRLMDYIYLHPTLRAFKRKYRNT